MHPPSYPDVTTSQPDQHSFFPPSASNIQPSSKLCIRPSHALHPPSPHLLVRVAIHDHLHLLHVHSIPTWKPSTGTASEPSPQIYEQSQEQKQDAAEEQRKFENAHLPSPISHRLRHGPEPHQTKGDKLRSVAIKETKMQKKRRDQKENGLERPRHPPSHTRQRRRLPRRPGKSVN